MSTSKLVEWGTTKNGQDLAMSPRKYTRLFLDFVAAGRRRAQKAGIASVLRFSPPRNTPVIYLDLGLHRAALQVRLMLAWFGPVCDLKVYAFEANPDYFRAASELLEGETRVTIVNAAVVGPDHHGGTVSLYLDGRGGLGDSIYSERGETSIEVPAIRLSDYIRNTAIEVTKKIAIVRMNIEGAELPVLKDLLSTSMAPHIDGWFGKWNDSAKISPAFGIELEKLKTANGIKNIAFNDSDSKALYWGLREALIRYELVTVMLGGKTVRLR